MLALSPMRHPYHPTACCFVYQIVPSPAFMRLCVALCITYCPDSRHIGENVFGKRTHIKRPGRWAFPSKRAAYGHYALPASESQVFISTLLIYNFRESRPQSSHGPPIADRGGGCRYRGGRICTASVMNFGVITGKRPTPDFIRRQAGALVRL